MGKHNDIIEIIVQFDSGNTGELEEEILQSHGFTPIYKTKIVPSIFAKGPASNISLLANIHEIKWVEWNAPMKYYMDQTIHTIKAICTQKLVDVMRNFICKTVVFKIKIKPAIL